MKKLHISHEKIANLEFIQVYSRWLFTIWHYPDNVERRVPTCIVRQGYGGVPRPAIPMKFFWA